MHKSQLISLFKILNKQEQTEFGRYVQTPFFNKNKQVIDLQKYIVRYQPDFESKRLTKNIVAEKLYKGQPEKTQLRKLAYAMSDLKKLLEDYLVWRESQQQAVDRDYLLLRCYEKRSADVHFFQTVNKLRERLEASGQQDMNYYYHQFKLHHLIFTHKSTDRISASVNGLNDSMDNLDLFYFTAKMKYACELANRQNIIANDETKPILLIDEVVELTKAAPFNENELFEAYRIYIHLCKQEDEGEYFRLKEIIFEKGKIFGSEELKEIYFFLINYCLDCYESGKTHFLEQVFKLYQHGIAQNLLIEHGYLDHVDFNNIVNIGCNLKEFDWIDTFITTYGALLEESIRPTAIALASAEVNVNKGDFEKALSFLQEVEFNDDYDKLRCKALQMMSYYELDTYHMLLLDFLNAFGMFIKRNKTLVKEHKQAYQNLIKITKKLFDVKQLRGQGLEDLTKLLAQTERLAWRSWVKRKVAELS